MPLKIKKNKYDFNFKRLIITIVKTENFSFLKVKVFGDYIDVMKDH